MYTYTIDQTKNIVQLQNEPKFIKYLNNKNILFHV